LGQLVTALAQLLMVQLFALLPQSRMQAALSQLILQVLPRLLPHLSSQVEPGAQSRMPSFALSAEAVHVELAAQLKLQWLGPEQLNAQVQPDGQD
jgi:hypothetical protein